MNCTSKLRLEWIPSAYEAATVSQRPQSTADIKATLVNQLVRRKSLKKEKNR